MFDVTIDSYNVPLDEYPARCAEYSGQTRLPMMECSGNAVQFRWQWVRGG